MYSISIRYWEAEATGPLGNVSNSQLQGLGHTSSYCESRVLHVLPVCMWISVGYTVSLLSLTFKLWGARGSQGTPCSCQSPPSPTTPAVVVYSTMR